jgi:hypothetical protein
MINKRKRFNRCLICSSENYEVTHRTHKKYIIEEHEKNQQLLEKIASKIPYTKVFGKLVQIPKDKVDFYISINIKIIYL